MKKVQENLYQIKALQGLVITTLLLSPMSVLGQVNNNDSLKSLLSQPNAINGHQFVDLGLPSGTLWATTNVGGSGNIDTGTYVAWGETEGKEQIKYSFVTYKHANGQQVAVQQIPYMLSRRDLKVTLKKYCLEQANGTVDGKTELEPIDDIASVKWGEGWTTPTIDQWTELSEECQWKDYIHEGRILYYKITGPNNNCIYLPATGYYTVYFGDNKPSFSGRNSLNLIETWDYWSKSIYKKGDSKGAYAFNIKKNGERNNYIYNRSSGLPVRPVVSKNAMTKVKETAKSITKLYVNSNDDFYHKIFSIQTYYGDEKLNNIIQKKYQGLKMSTELESMAKSGNTEAMILAGYCYYSGLGVEKSFNSAEEIWYDAAGKGNYCGLIFLYSQGYVRSGNYRALELLNKAVKEKFAPAMVVKVHEETFDNSNQTELINLLRQAANSGYPEAEAQYGIKTNNIEYVEKAAKKNCIVACKTLVNYYDNNKQYTKAYPFALQAKSLGVEYTDKYMNYLHAYSGANSTDSKEIAWAMGYCIDNEQWQLLSQIYNRAKKNNYLNDDCEIYYAVYLRSTGNPSAAMTILTKYAETSVKAQEELAYSYANGVGMAAPDMTTAFKYYKKAAANGSKRAQDFLKGRNMTW